MKRLNKLKGMYALLIAVATMIGITIYGSCSADEEYDYVSYAEQELSTRAEGVMRGGNEGNGNSYTLPSVDMIISNQSVIDSMDLAWRMTIDCLNNNHQRIEHGFYIFYNPTNGKFGFSQMFSSNPIICGQKSKSFTMPQVMYKQGYVGCALFHTHTSLKYCLPNISRPTGLSHEDSLSANSVSPKVPIIIYDYSGPVVYGGDSENNPHIPYFYNPNDDE